MSRQLALDTVNLKPTPRLAHTEYSMEYHTDYVSRVAGVPPGHPERSRRFYAAWDFDMLWSSNDGLRGNWGQYGRVTDMGHAEYAADGSDLRAMHESPFRRAEDVWAFDAVKEYGLPDMAEQVAAYQAGHTNALTSFPDQLVTGGYYKTIVSGAIQAFGWDMFLTAAADPAKIEKVLDSFFRYTLFHMQAWARTDVEVVIQHDDFVWSEGCFMSPDFYRRAIIARFAELWKPLHAAGKKVLFCSDGTFTELAEDLAAAGADGFIFEPSNDFGFMVDRFGGSHCLVGSCVDCRTMTFGAWADVKAQIDRTLELAPRCRGLMFAVGNHMPANISDEMVDRFITYLRAHWARHDA
ncbi:MAG: Uroporphyrinogen decarboxylase (URO-D) [Lentisphaerae bacterium ADurb.BinA184]|nr:MAG: Uroporphyrinogen decarboxylase (URO-D) [Lentisphaerae bacterium ADurb.BinA184]